MDRWMRIDKQIVAKYALILTLRSARLGSPRLGSEQEIHTLLLFIFEKTVYFIQKAAKQSIINNLLIKGSKYVCE